MDTERIIASTRLPRSRRCSLDTPWYAYQSLGLWWVRALSAEEQRFLCQQARAYATLSARIAIKGFRFVQREITETCLVSRDPEGAERTDPPGR